MAAALLAFSAYALQAVHLPGRVLACSCAGPPSMAELVPREGLALLIGTVGQRGPDVTPITVEGWFGQPDPPDLVFIMSGESFGSSCDLYVGTNERWLLTLYRTREGPYDTSTCSPNGQLGTPDGDALVADAIAVFGAPTSPPPPTPAPDPTRAPSGQPQPPPSSQPVAPEPEPETLSPIVIEPSPLLAQGLIWVAAAVGVGVLLLGAITLVAPRRPPN